MGQYLQGNPVQVFTPLPFSDEDGEPTNPTLTVCKVRDPRGTVVTYTFGVEPDLTNPSPGSFALLLPAGDLTLVGVWHYEWIGTGAVEASADGEFEILASSVTAPEAEGPTLLPYTLWVDGQDIAAVCAPAREALGSDYQMLEQFAAEASMTLYELSGHRFSGLSQPVTVRPCNNRCGCWGAWTGVPWSYWALSWTYMPWSGVWNSRQGDSCGCEPMSRVKLSGYPVREITQVKINGEVLPAEDDDGNPNYRLDGFKWLTRMRNPANSDSIRLWPGCQRMDLDDDQQGTFSVTYRHGVDPPPLGISAAAELACQLALSYLQHEDCELPATAVSVNRQGVSVQLNPFVNWGQGANGSWQTGLPKVDLFLSTYNREGMTRPPAVWSPDIQQFARRQG